VRGGFTFKFDKNSTNLWCFIFLEAHGALFGGAKPTKAPMWRRGCITFTFKTAVNHGFSNFWSSGQKPHLLKDFKCILNVKTGFDLNSSPNESIVPESVSEHTLMYSVYKVKSISPLSRYRPLPVAVTECKTMTIDNGQIRPKSFPNFDERQSI